MATAVFLSHSFIQVDYKNATTKFLGWVVASYSFGQLVASPVFGIWADHRPTREPLIVALVFNVIFNVLYSYCEAFGGGVAGWVMIASRTLVGFGAGLLSERERERERINSCFCRHWCCHTILCL